ncbi:MAG: type II toxin-antitoxin system HicB family antitoxin [Synergistaceae bacterium]|nr:type II toxin-antitoxin system HicB family antitoxin [Synergistaceae bacterium]
MTITRDKDGYYIGSIPSLPGCHTQARTLEELDSNMKEAIQLYDYNDDIEFIGLQKIAM